MITTEDVKRQKTTDESIRNHKTTSIHLFYGNRDGRANDKIIGGKPLTYRTPGMHPTTPSPSTSSQAKESKIITPWPSQKLTEIKQTSAIYLIVRTQKLKRCILSPSPLFPLFYKREICKKTKEVVFEMKSFSLVENYLCSLCSCFPFSFLQSSPSSILLSALPPILSLSPIIRQRITGDYLRHLSDYEALSSPSDQVSSSIFHRVDSSPINP